jgi:hypothetical protein
VIDVKQSFLGGLDLDTSPLALRPDSYIDALNITRDSVTANQDFAVTNVVGNREVEFEYPSGEGHVIGASANTLRNTVIFFRWNENGNHGVYEFNKTTRTIVKVFENLTDSDDEDILGFTQNDKITSINILNRDEGDLLFFLDSLGRPTVMNITEMKAGTYTPVTRDIIDVAKKPPLSPPAAVYDNDTTRRTNDTRNKLFRFKYRFVYDDNEKSTFSPISAVPYPASILDEEYTNVVTNNNVISLSLLSGDKNVKKVEIAMSFVNKTNEWSDFSLVESIDKEDESIGDNETFNYQFYNDGTYPFIDVNESILIFDNVPHAANAQELVNGNVLAYAGIEEGLDRDLDANVELTIGTIEAGDGSSVGSLNATRIAIGLTVIPPGFQTEVAFAGVPAVGTLVDVRVRQHDDTVITASYYTTVAGDTPSSICLALEANETAGDCEITRTGDSIQVVTESAVYKPFADGFWVQVVVTQPSSSATEDSIATWKHSTSRRIGLAYYDKKGRTNGVLYSDKVTFPAYNENGSQQVLLPYINAKIYHVPPDWAHSFQFVFTKEPTRYLFWITSEVNTTETEYIYFNITGLNLNAQKLPTTAAVLNYTFADGDRLRLIRNMADNTVYTDVYDASVDGVVTDPTINGVSTTGLFVKIKKVFPFDTLITAFESGAFVIELYRPGQSAPNSENQAFFEFGAEYPILNPETEDRVHGGMVENQDIDTNTPAEFDFYYGDAYFRLRNVATSESGSSQFNVLDRNFVDFYTSAVSSIDGRPSIVDVNARRAYFPAMIRFGQSYQANTNVNGLNRFYPNNFEDCDYSFGDIMRIKVRDRYLRVFQKYKVGTIPLYSQLSKDSGGNNIQVVTDRLLNPIQYYVGNWGIGDAAESLISHNFADYFCDNISGVICRVSNDGVQPISKMYKVDSWAFSKLPLRKDNYKIYGAFDPPNGFVFALEAADTDSAATISFDEETNVFESLLSYHPEMMVTLGTLLISFKDGSLWTHDNTLYNTFYGVSYESSITPVFNKGGLQKKSWVSVTEVASSIWDCPLIYTNVQSYAGQRQESNLIESDFEMLENCYHAAFLRDIHSIDWIEDGDSLKGNYIAIKFRKESATELVNLNIVSVKFLNSPLTSL